MSRLILLLKKEKPDLCLTFTIKPNIYTCLAGKILGMEVFPNVAGLGRVFEQNTLLTSLVSILYKIAFHGQKKIFFQNNDDIKLFTKQRLVPHQVCERLPGSGVDLKKFKYVPLRKKDVGESIKFLLVSRLLWSKGIGEFVAAAELVKAERADVAFHILGFLNSQVTPDSVTPKQIDEWESRGIVKYLGSTQDVRSFIEASDCIVLPTFYREGVPKALLETSAIGRPIITTNFVGTKDIVKHGLNGFLVEPKDVSGLKLAIEEFIGLDHEAKLSMGLAGRRLVEQSFSETKVIESYVGIVES